MQIHAHKSSLVPALIGGLLAGPMAPAEARPRVVLFQTGFEEADTLGRWPGAEPPDVRLLREPDGATVLLIERRRDEGPGDRMVRTRLPVAELRGKRVLVAARIRADSVAEPPKPWSGVKCMLHIVTPAGESWPQQNGLFGSFPWKTVRFVADIPRDATLVELILGVEQTTGRAWFDCVRISLVREGRSSRPEKSSTPAFTGHDLARLRGAQVAPEATLSDLRVLASRWGANHIRWQLYWRDAQGSPADRASLEEYQRWLQSALADLDAVLPLCDEFGIQVVVALLTPPGGHDEAGDARIFREARFQRAFVEVWTTIATRYHDTTAIWGYDLVNEPIVGVVPASLMDWRDLAAATGVAIRRIDSTHAVIVEPDPGASPDALEMFQPLDVPGVVYSIHMYAPHAFTHQGIGDRPTGIAYPGDAEGRRWDRALLRQKLQPAIDFQREHGVHIYVGEFGAVRWAPHESAERYLRDCIEIFEENGWDWAYHAFREWDGWSAEHGTRQNDKRPAATPTGREKLLRSWYQKNTVAR